MSSWLLLLCVLLTACPGPREQVILLPGSAAPLTITTAQGLSLTLDTAYQTATARPSGRLDAGITTAEIVQARYGAVLATVPEAGRRYALYFAPGGIALAPASQGVLQHILADIAAHSATEVLIEGHTDTTGDALANDRLSLERAEAVRALLVAAGMQAAFVRVVGRGERELLIETADDVDEPQNRRVEVLIR